MIRKKIMRKIKNKKRLTFQKNQSNKRFQHKSNKFQRSKKNKKKKN